MTVDECSETAEEPLRPLRLARLLALKERWLRETGWKTCTRGTVRFQVRGDIFHAQFSTAAQGLLKLLIDPMHRMQWDRSVIEMDTIDVLSPTELVQRTIQQNCLVRERVEYVALAEAAGKTALVAQSVKKERSEQAQVHCFAVELTQHTVEVTSKIDWRLPPKQFSAQDLFQAFQSWVCSFQTALSNNHFLYLA